MKKSDMTVSMPLSTWEEYEAYKRKYRELTQELAECFDTTSPGADTAQFVDFDAKKALEICRRFMPYSMEKADIEIRV